MWVVITAALGLFAAEPAATVAVSINPEVSLGRIKNMHAVNNGPTVKKPGGDQKCGNFEDYKAARIPFARTHDSINCVAGSAHTCDISVVFPDFDADENDPRNYDFVFTDHYLDNIRRAGTEVFFRLGQTIEHGPKKYGVLPPKDYAKWARIAEHVIRHYNEGWGWGLDTAPTTVNIAWSNQFNIVYWEIWNEPDTDRGGIWRTNPRCWGGSYEEFCLFFATVAKHLKLTFPDLKVGGPALAGAEDWGDLFLEYCSTNSVPLDFFSWHVYVNDPKYIADMATRMRGLMVKHGYGKSESILNEWNFVRGWGDDFVYSLRVESGDLNLKGAAFVISTMIDCQSVPVDMLMYYDARVSTSMNGMFDQVTKWPLKGYYPFYAWSRLKDYGEQVDCTVSHGKNADGFHAVAAKDGNGSIAILVSRYLDDENVSDMGIVTFKVPNAKRGKVKCHLTDLVRAYTEVPVDMDSDGMFRIRMMPYSFALIEVSD